MPKSVQHYQGVEKILNPFEEQNNNKYPTLSHSFNAYGAASNDVLKMEQTFQMGYKKGEKTFYMSPTNWKCEEEEVHPTC